MTVSTDPRYSLMYVTGVLDVSAAIYPSALAVKSRNDDVKRMLQGEFGGRIEPTRWISRSVVQRKTILTSWLSNSRSKTRKMEIAAALYALEHRND